MICRLQEERERQAQLRGPPKIDPYNAATTIQKVHLLWHSILCSMQWFIETHGPSVVHAITLTPAWQDTLGHAATATCKLVGVSYKCTLHIAGKKKKSWGGAGISHTQTLVTWYAFIKSSVYCCPEDELKHQQAIEFILCSNWDVPSIYTVIIVH